MPFSRKILHELPTLQMRARQGIMTGNKSYKGRQGMAQRQARKGTKEEGKVQRQARKGTRAGEENQNLRLR
jgi:hypothetical protein